MKKIYFLSLLVISLIFVSACENGNADVINPNDSNINNDIVTTLYRKGAENPKVVLEEYSDLFCPFCGSVQPILDNLIYDFKDKLAVEFHHFYIERHNSLDVHMANECAGEQGKFWEFNQAAFKRENQAKLSEGGRSAIIELSENLGLDRDKIRACLLSEKYKNKIESQKTESLRKYDIEGTPSFVIDGNLVEIPENMGFYEGLKSIIESYLNKPMA